MKSIKIIGGKIISFAPNFPKDVEEILVENGKITALGKELPKADVEIDAKDLVIAPGFIDIHMHEEECDLYEEDEFDISIPMVQMGVTTGIGGNCGSNKTDPATFKNKLNTTGFPINYMLYAGYNSARRKAQVKDEDVPNVEQEKEIQKEIQRILDLGGVGISLGIEYIPSISTKEILTVLAPWKGRRELLLTAHYRYDGEKAVEAIEEMCEISKTLDIPFQISHISSCSAFGNMEEALEKIEEYRKEGIDITVDAYPYGAFSTYIGSEVFTPGCFERWNAKMDQVILKDEPYDNMPLTEEILADARENYPNMLAIAKVMNEEEIKYSLTKPYVMVGSDGLYRNHKGHPRGAGTFPRILGRYVREEGLLTLEEAIYKMTAFPAKRLNIYGRKGDIDIGFDGDLVIFKEDEILDIADFEEGQKPPLGISYVLVNGEIVVKNGRYTGKHPGRFLGREL